MWGGGGMEVTKYRLVFEVFTCILNLEETIATKCIVQYF